MGTNAAQAAYLSGARDPGRVIWASQYLQAGQPYTIQTANLSGYSDTVLHVIGFGNTVGDDDAGGGRASRVVFVPPVPGYYQILVRAYSDGTAGTCDLLVNGAPVLRENPFAGARFDYNWVPGERIGVAGTQRGYGNDFMLFLLGSKTYLMGWDDDSGPNLYPFMNPTYGSSSGMVVWALYPGNTGVGRAHIQDQPHDCGLAFGNDWDCDGLTDGFEALAASAFPGQSGSMGDSDRDTIPDSYEIMGNDGWSFSEGGSPVQPDIYVEVDYMQGRRPYSGLAADVANILAADGNLKITVVVDQQIPSYDYVTFFFNCGSLSSCAQYSNLKTAYFNVGTDTSRRHFHYAIFANQQLSFDLTGGHPVCNSGVGELYGNDFIVSLDPVHCGWQFNDTEQRGTFVHELGHNLNFTHNGNDSADPNARSFTHASVMNYRYQIDGVPTSSGNRHTYSFGRNPCVPCATSPKQACANARGSGMCWAEGGCDCDYNEWTNRLLTFTSNNNPIQVGTDIHELADHDALGKRFTKRHREPLTSSESARFILAENTKIRRRLVEQRAQELTGQGYERGKHFDLSPDGLHLYMP
jgi:hypothetical protein